MVLTNCYSQVPNMFFQTSYTPQFEDILVTDIKELELQRTKFKKMRDLVDNNRLVELADKFETLLVLMRNLAEIEDIISCQVKQISELRQQNFSLADDLNKIKNEILIKVRKKNLILKGLTISKGIQLIKETHQKLTQSNSSYDFGQRSILIQKCEEIYGRDLKGIVIIERMVTNLSSIHQNQLLGARSEFLGKMTKLLDSVYE